ncbi:MAG: competence protein ComEA [Desulfobacteraceae bacterium 4484_190.3]|nr:MAG: competence protein ComEA [Desulfobacteraceae bacterium 4484_190.3]
MKHLPKFILAACCVVFLTGLLVGSALADGVVSFNKASVKEIMDLCEELNLPEELAKAIVKYREKNGPFKKPEDLQKVPGMTHDFLEELNPIIKDGDVIYDPDAEPGLAPSKC